MKYTIPGRESLDIQTIILDLNGTLSIGGSIVDGVAERLSTLSDRGFKLVLLTGDTRGDADVLAKDLGVSWQHAGTAQEKADAAASLNAATSAAIGNGLIDKDMMDIVSLSILTLQAEGIHTATMRISDIIVPSIIDALDLFIDEKRLIATLRA